MMGDNSFLLLDVLCLAAAVGVIFMGSKELKSGDLTGRKDLNEYTEESRRELSRKEGPLYIMIGIVGLIASLSSQNIHVLPLPTIVYWICIAGVFAGIIVDAILIKKTLVKKNKFTDYDLHKKLK